MAPLHAKTNSLFEVVFESQILCYEDRLAILLHHMEVVGRVYLALKQYSNATEVNA